MIMCYYRPIPKRNTNQTEQIMKMELFTNKLELATNQSELMNVLYDAMDYYGFEILDDEELGDTLERAYEEDLCEGVIEVLRTAIDCEIELDNLYND